MRGILPEPIRLRQGKAQFGEVYRQAFVDLELRRRLRSAAVLDLGLVDQPHLERLQVAAEGGVAVPGWASVLWRIIQVEVLVAAVG